MNTNLLLFGTFILLLALGQICAGVSWGRNGPMIRRSEEPKKFWDHVMTNVVFGIVVIAMAALTGK